MELNEELIKQIARKVIQELCEKDAYRIPVGVSNRHIHLSREDMDILFGKDSQLTRMKDVKQPGQYAAEETVTLKGPKGEMKKVRILGPLRKETQAEISISDGFKLGVAPPIRLSGHLEGTPGMEIIGPCGSVKKEKGLIAALRHVHMLPATAGKLGLRDGDVVDVEVGGIRGGIMGNVLVRVTDASAFEMHIDVEEANAFHLKNDDYVRILKR